MASLIYGSCVRDFLTGAIDFDTDTFKAMLVNSTYDAIADETKRDSHTKRSDVTANEVTGTNYTAGGASCTVSVAAYDGTNNRVDVTLGSVSWASSTITASGLVVYKSRGGADTADELVAYIDFGAEITSTNGTFSVTASTLRLSL